MCVLSLPIATDLTINLMSSSLVCDFFRLEHDHGTTVGEHCTIPLSIEWFSCILGVMIVVSTKSAESVHTRQHILIAVEVETAD